MFTIESILGTLFSATAVRLASMGIALYVGLTLGGEAIDMLTSVGDTLHAINAR